MSKQLVLGIIALIGLGALSPPSAGAGERAGSARVADAANSPKPDRIRLFGVRTLSSKTYSRVTIDLSHEVRYETHRLAGNPVRGLPPRIYIDLFNVKFAMDSKGPIVVEDGLLRQVRISEFSPDAVRVVIDMTSLREYNAFLLPDPYRLVIDIQGQKTGGAVAAVENGQKRAPAPAAKAKQNHGPAIRKIVLDPGHGGKDPGAMSTGGIAEKDIVLAVAKKLATKLRQDMGATVVLTRTDDRFIPLEERTAIANAEGADLFISLHMNASPNPEARGLETYYLDNTNDEASIRLAARENGTSRKQVS
ncbi:MAG: N-acetylmuramoyl-L-alanine amidase, partial [Candidatus Binatia bacterium]